MKKRYKLQNNNLHTSIMLGVMNKFLFHTILIKTNAISLFCLFQCFNAIFYQYLNIVWYLSLLRNMPLKKQSKLFIQDYPVCLKRAGECTHTGRNWTWAWLSKVLNTSFICAFARCQLWNSYRGHLSLGAPIIDQNL